jgi:hypothetical protein
MVKTKSILIMKTYKFTYLILLAVFAGSLSLSAQEQAKKTGFEAITVDAIKGQLEFLSSDWTEGREAGSKGAYMAADYIASMFKLYGLEPGGDTPRRSFGRFGRGETPPPPERTYFQNFELVEWWPGDVQELSVITKNGDAVKSVDFNYQTDFTISSGQAGIEASVPVVFVGYGLQDEEKGYDDLKGLDLEGKIVIKLEGFPGHKNPGSKTYEKFKPEDSQDQEDPRARMFRRYGRGNRYPWASEKGVLAIIEYNPNANPAAGWADNDQFFPPETNGPSRSGVRKSMRLPGDDVGSGQVSLEVTNRVVNELISGLNLNFDDLEKKIDETGKPASMVLPGKFVHLKTTVNSRMVKVRNVIGVIEGEDTSNTIVVGGHYDHLGIRDGWIYNGADDNASGTVGVMTIAKAMAASGVKPKKTIVFCAWTAEEKGLIGSSYFVDHPYDGKNVLCNLNYDMISRDAQVRDQDRYPRMTFTSSFPLFQELTEKHNKEYNIDLDVVYSGSEQPGGGSDHAPFARAGIPIFYFMAGMPPEYHQPGDHIDLVNWEKMLKIVQLGYLNIFELSNMDWD